MAASAQADSSVRDRTDLARQEVEQDLQLARSEFARVCDFKHRYPDPFRERASDAVVKMSERIAVKINVQSERLRAYIDSPLRIANRIHQINLRDRLDETCAFFVLSGRDRLCIESAESRRPVRRTCPPGLRAPFHLGAAGKVLLAFGDTEALLGQIQVEDGRYQLATGQLRAIDELRAECSAVGRDGYAFSRQESTLESWAVAVPFFVNGEFAGALGVAVPMTRDDPAHHQEVINQAKETATA